MTSSTIPDTLASSEAFSQFCTARGVSLPANAGALLYGVTPLVLDATSGARYDTDPSTGLATDPAIAKALADATCLQALAWSKLNIDPDTGGVVTAGVKTAKGIGTARMSYADTGEAAAARTAAVSGLVPAAVARLRQLNLLDATAWSQG
ncbi:hypothetical protein [Curtobacterium sp. UCD-KPL2560]|uniref:hypothetical protein n=1 Tax=Curtobacterium sp. UCD-KPL2560 TaxID=1885315 RepID=UPI0008253ABF|nr:hypothetical protein [Curtobacterium sp. UCD-KPL2560]